MKKLFISILILLLSISSSSAAGITNPRLMGTDCTETKPTDFADAKEIEIEYAGHDNATYSRTTPRQISAIVWHDPGDNNCGALYNLVSYGQRPNARPECGGSCGYTFYIDTAGKIVQAAPMSVRTNHATSYNPISYGITLICAAGKKSLPDPQVKSSVLLSQVLRTAYGFNNMIPHGIMPQRMNDEGRLITNITRASPIDGNGKYLVNYKLGRGKQLYCKIEGKIPACTSNCDNSPLVGVTPVPQGGTNYPPFSSPYTDGKGNYRGDSADWGYPLMRPPVQQTPTNPFLSPLANTLNPFLNVATPSATTSPLQGNSKCTGIYIQTNKDNFYRILETYNSTYKEQYGEWQKAKDMSISSLDITKILAKVYATNLFKIYQNLEKCVP